MVTIKRWNDIRDKQVAAAGGDLLDRADGRDRAEVYRRLGLKLIYEQGPQTPDRRGIGLGDHVRNRVSEGRSIP